MTSAVFYRKDGVLTGFRVSGHAGHGDSGDDVVCAAVSSAVSLTANLVTDFFGADARVDVQGDVIALKAADSRDEDVQRLLEGLADHLRFISGQYGKKYLKVSFTEV